MASSPSTAFVPPPLAARRLPSSAAAAAAKAPPTPGGSFTPGHGAGVAAHPAAAAAAHTSLSRMGATPDSPSRAAWAAAALRAAGGVDPSTHHVAAVLRRAGRGGRGGHAAPAEELATPSYESPAPPTASVVNEAPSAAVRAWVAAQLAPAAVAAPALTVTAVSAPTGGEWARRQARLSRHVAARWAASASASPPEPTPSPVPAATPVTATPVSRAPHSMGPPPVNTSAEASPPPPPPDDLVTLLSPPQASSPLTSAAAVLDASASDAASQRAAMDPPTDVKSLLYPPAPASPVEDVASRLGSSEAYTAPPPPPPPSESPPAEAEKPKTLGEYLNTPMGSSPLESAAAVLARSARLAPSGKAAMEEPPRLAALLNAPPSPVSPLEMMAAMLAPPEPEAPPAEYPPEAYVDWDKAPPRAATPLEASANMLERSARLDPSGKAAMEIPPPLAELLDAPPDKESPLQEMARRIVDGRAGDVAASAAAAAGDEVSEEAEEVAEGADGAASEPSASAEAAEEPSAALLTPPPGDSPLAAAAAVLAQSARLAPTGKAAMEVPPPLATLLRSPSATSPLTEAATRLAVRDKVKKVVEAAPRRFDVSTTTRSPGPAPLSSPKEVKELLTAPPARSPLTMAADRLSSPSPVGVSTSELEGAARVAAAWEARDKPSTGAPVVPAAPSTLPTIATAALTGMAQPPAADAVKDESAPVRDVWRVAVPPAVTMAFVGACLALSQAAGAVMDAGVPLN